MNLNKGIVMIMLLTTACNTATEQNVVEEQKSLQKELEAKKQKWMDGASEEKVALYERGIQEIRDEGILTSAIHEGQIAPDFELKNDRGEWISLEDKLEKGPVILTWYRGGWCPYCNMTLAALQDNLPEITALGGSVLALSPELQDSVESTANENSIEFEMLSDVANQVAHSYGLVFTLIPEIADGMNEKFKAYNGDESHELPVPATYVIDQQGVVRYAFLDPDYRTRAEPSDLIEVLRMIKSEEE